MSPASASRKPLTGAQKSAVLCIVLGPKEASKILRELSPEDVEEVTREIAAMPEVDPEVVREVIAEFQTAARASRPSARGGIQTAQQLLEQALGAARAQEVVSKIHHPGSAKGLKVLKKAAPETVAGILRSEHPQMIAVVLSRLDAVAAAKILRELPREGAADILMRMARMQPIDPTTLASIEEGLHSKANLSLGQPRTETGGPAAVAQLLNAARPGLDEELLQQLDARNTELATQVKKLMFVFEDLILVDGKGIQRVLREIDTKDLAFSLKASSPEVAAHIKSNMSERAGAALDEEIELLGAVRIKDVNEAQERIVDVARQLEQDGEIVVKRGGSSDEFV